MVTAYQIESICEVVIKDLHPSFIGRQSLRFSFSKGRGFPHNAAR